MPIAAVPKYLGKDFSNASPGLRFGMYLSIWTTRKDQRGEVEQRANQNSGEGREIKQLIKEVGMDDAIERLCRRKKNPVPRLWEKNTASASTVWENVRKLSACDQKTLEALVARQDHLAAMVMPEQRLVVDAEAMAPFVTGLGHEHPLENGFAFYWPYGLPYLPGSGVKGVLRQAARELVAASAAAGNPDSAWSDEDITALFGSEDSEQPARGALHFWDVLPNTNGKALHLEVMTPHQTHYYQKGEPPHDCGQPIPICFLTVPPGARFTFHVMCDLSFLRGSASPELAEGGRWRTLLHQAFEHAFEWLGFGAKTAVGYGALRLDPEAGRQRRQREGQARAEAARQAALEAATAGLPDDAAQIERWRAGSDWQDNNRFLEQVEGLLEHRTPLSAEACERLRVELNARWKGILADPNAVQGKKKKFRFKPRPRNLALRLIELCQAGEGGPP